jgi:hypothetical protein
MPVTSRDLISKNILQIALSLVAALLLIGFYANSTIRESRVDHTVPANQVHTFPAAPRPGSIP